LKDAEQMFSVRVTLLRKSLISRLPQWCAQAATSSQGFGASGRVTAAGGKSFAVRNPPNSPIPATMQTAQTFAGEKAVGIGGSAIGGLGIGGFSTGVFSIERNALNPVPTPTKAARARRA
jgi:hypothetical protein